MSREKETQHSSAISLIVSGSLLGIFLLKLLVFHSISSLLSQSVCFSSPIQFLLLYRYPLYLFVYFIVFVSSKVLFSIWLCFSA